jgi:integrase/recombinase XerD
MLPAIVSEPSDPLARLAEMFVATRRSPHTVRAYRRDLAAWLDWCRDRGFDPLDIRQAHVNIWLTNRAEAGDSDPTRARRLAAVSSWYRWLIRQEVTTRNPADLDSTERPAGTRDTSPTAVLSVEQTQELIDLADKDRNPSTAAIVALLLYGALRVDELVSADEDALTTDRGQPVLDVIGKGRRQRRVPVPPPAWDRLDRYRLARPDREGDNLPAKTVGVVPALPLVARSTGRRLTQGEVWRILRRLAMKGSPGLRALAPHLSPHSLRHTAATFALDEGVALRDVQDWLGHADPRTTRRYDHGKLNLERHPAGRLAELLAR